MILIWFLKGIPIFFNVLNDKNQSFSTLACVKPFYAGKKAKKQDFIAKPCMWWNYIHKECILKFYATWLWLRSVDSAWKK